MGTQRRHSARDSIQNKSRSIPQSTSWTGDAPVSISAMWRLGLGLKDLEQVGSFGVLKGKTIFTAKLIVQGALDVGISCACLVGRISSICLVPPGFHAHNSKACAQGIIRRACIILPVISGSWDALHPAPPYLGFSPSAGCQVVAHKMQSKQDAAQEGRL